MIIRFELPDKDGQAFKIKCHSNGIIMSALIRQWIREFLRESTIILPDEGKTEFGEK